MLKNFSLRIIILSAIKMKQGKIKLSLKKLSFENLTSRKYILSILKLEKIQT